MDIARFKNDLLNGKVKELKLVYTDIEVIESNRDGMIFNTWRKVKDVYENRFELETQRCKDGKPINKWCVCEGYFLAFKGYDGKKLWNDDTVYEVR